MKDFKSNYKIRHILHFLNILIPLIKHQGTQMMNKLLDMPVYVTKHFWDGFMMIQLAQDMDVFMLNRLNRS